MYRGSLGLRCVTHTARAWLPGLALTALLAACSGSTGSQGPAGAAGPPGPPGPQGPGAGIAALEVTAPSTTAITATITSVTFDAPQHPQVNFSLTDQNGTPLKGLTSAQAEFTIAQLIDGAVAKTGYTSSGAKQWVSFIITPGNPPNPCPVASALRLRRLSEPRSPGARWSTVGMVATPIRSPPT